MKSTASAYGMELDQYLMAIGYDAEKFQEEIRTAVEKYTKRKMIICAIAEKEDINVSKAEADAKIQELLKSTGLSDVKDLNSRTGYSDQDYYYMILEEKVVDFVYSNADPKKTGSEPTTIVDTTEGGTESKTEAKTEAQTESKTENKTESQTESKSEN